MFSRIRSVKQIQRLVSPRISTPLFSFNNSLSLRMMSSGRPEKSEFENRALELLRGFEKIDAKKLSLDAHFNKDLGLDSLDTVEVLMAIEDEFMIEIPDQEADQMHTIKDAINYVYARWTPQHNW